MKDITKLQNALPDANIVELSGGHGVNIYLSDCVISAYWKKGKYGDNKTSQWNYFNDVDELIEIIKLACEKPISKAIVTEVKTDGGVQSCIDHINKKAEYAKSIKGADNAVVTMLFTVAKELEQYL